MAKRSKRRRTHPRPDSRTPAPRDTDRPPAPPLVRRKRFLSTVGIWVFIMVFLIAPIFMGSPLFVIPAVGFTVAQMATMRRAREPFGPDAQTLEPGALAGATDASPVVVTNVWIMAVGARGRGSDRGELRFADRRLSFADDAGATRFDVPVHKVAIAGKPGFLRPQLELRVEDRPETIRFMPPWDLGATFVGPIIAEEWGAQLRELGAK